MRFSVRVQGGSHDTVWDEAEVIEGGWLRCRSYEEDEHGQEAAAADERWYPPTSVYSVQPIE